MRGFRSAGKSKVATTGDATQKTLVVAGSVGFRDRLLRLHLPDEVVDAILYTPYYVTDTQTKPIFAVSLDAKKPTEWVFNPTEVQEAVLVFKDMESKSPTAVVDFINYLQTISLNKTQKSRKNLLLPDDSVYESPGLAEWRREETLKVNLQNRAKIPQKGIRCKRAGCTSDEVFEEDRQLRAGDEGVNWLRTCSKCGHKWKI